MKHVFFLSLALLAACAPAESPEQRVARVAAEVQQHPAWVEDAARCPADLMPARDAPTLTNTCAGEGMDRCLERCEDDDPTGCYWLAQELLTAKAAQPALDALFQRSCALGNASGCTNHAAYLLVGGNGDAACAARTFEKTCEHDDPWGCTMLAALLERGEGVEKDPQRALRVIAKSCLDGEDDPACTAAHRLEARLRGAEQ